MAMPDLEFQLYGSTAQAGAWLHPSSKHTCGVEGVGTTPRPQRHRTFAGSGEESCLTCGNLFKNIFDTAPGQDIVIRNATQNHVNEHQHCLSNVGLPEGAPESDVLRTGYPKG